MGKAGQLHMAILFLEINSRIIKIVDSSIQKKSHILMLESSQELKTTHQMISS
jgi:hypothetical protein